MVVNIEKDVGGYRFEDGFCVGYFGDFNVMGFNLIGIVVYGFIFFF